MLLITEAESDSSVVLTSFFRWEKVTVVQLKSSGDNQPFSSLQCRMAVPVKIQKKRGKFNYVSGKCFPDRRQPS